MTMTITTMMMTLAIITTIHHQVLNTYIEGIEPFLRTPTPSTLIEKEVITTNSHISDGGSDEARVHANWHQTIVRTGG